MSTSVIPAPLQPSVAVLGTAERFPIHRIYCVGRNYAEHAREMGASGQEPPFFFMKPADAVLPVAADTTGELPYPSLTQDLHHEVELVVALKSGGENIPVDKALDHVFGYAVGLDLTRRDLQAAAKAKGLPWDTGKGFDHSAPVSALLPAADAGDYAAMALDLDINGVRRQHGELRDLVWDVADILHELSKLYALRTGDLVFMGTPAGVGPLLPGDHFHARLHPHGLVVDGVIAPAR